MNASLRAMLERAIDYAGLFPPASLSMHEAAGRYAAYRGEPEQWLLGRFVVPAARLPELADAFAVTQLPPVAALFRGGATVAEFWQTFESDLQAARGWPAPVTVWEGRLPAEAVGVDSSQDLDKLLGAIADRLSEHSSTSQVYWESPASPEVGADVVWRTSLDRVLTSLEDYQNTQADSACRMGFKLRTGGLKAADVPSCDQVARVICDCRDAGLAWKATAGLHQALRHDDSELGVPVHGFLNLFAAAVLSQAHQLSESDVTVILADRDPGSFEFTDQALRYHNLQLTTAEIAETRRQSLHSFGSCSLDEPREGLRMLFSESDCASRSS